MDFEREVALVVTIGQGKDKTIIGGRYIANEDAGDEKSAEIAEDGQGQGIASGILRHLIQIARAKGKELARLDAEVLAGNRSMLAVFSRSGLPMKTERLDDVVLVTLALGA